MRDRARRATQTASERQATLQRKSTRKKGKLNLRGERNEVRVDDRLAVENPRRETEDNYSRQGPTITAEKHQPTQMVGS